MIETREIHLKARPAGPPTPDAFEMKTVPLAPPGPGQVQVRNSWMSLDPSMRGRMYEAKSYVPPFRIGEALEGRAVGRVVASNSDALSVGDLVSSTLGWREAFNAPAEAVEKIEPGGLPEEAFLGVAGLTGLTAYVGLVHLAELKADDVVFVSAASGAVGSTVCQIAKLLGNKVIGSAGGPAKTDFLLSDLGIDAAIDYKAEASLSKALRRAAPEGIDVYFDNVGGAHLEAALTCANPFARFALCGMISTYNLETPAAGPRNIMLAVSKNITLRGYIILNYPHLRDEFQARVRGWWAAGKIRQIQTVSEGLDSAVDAFLGLFQGRNLGKTLVQL
jgi:hypothetical protein